MRRKTVGLFTPYLDTMGGGERHILSILKVFDEKGYQVVIFWDKDVSSLMKERLHISFKHLTFAKDLRKQTFLEKAKLLSPLDWMIYVTDGSYFFSPAKHTAIFCMVPNPALYRMSPLNLLKTTNAHFIANSHFTQAKLKGWGIESKVVYPFIAEELFTDGLPVKKPIVLAVGRFFRHLHAKKQDQLIRTFLRFHDRFPEFSLVLAGGVAEEDKTYVGELRRQFPQPYIHFKTNIPFHELQKLYQDALLFWHFTGFGVDEHQEPHKVEHMGMTPLEAMAAKVISFCYNAGGPKEIIDNGKTGYLFSSSEELVQQATYVVHTPSLQRSIQEAAYQLVRRTFAYTHFEHAVVHTFHL